MRNKTLFFTLVAVITGAAVVAILVSGSRTPNRDPLGEEFPRVTGASLEGDAVVIPDDFAGMPLVVLLGYVQEAQFDADRWLYGLLQAGLDVKIREVPTVKGIFPGLISERIDSGMRAGIPREDWATVITVYDDAERIVALTGDENPRNIRVLLLDATGRVAWFHDRGFSAGKLIELENAVVAMREDAGPPIGGPAR